MDNRTRNFAVGAAMVLVFGILIWKYRTHHKEESSLQPEDIFTEKPAESAKQDREEQGDREAAVDESLTPEQGHTLNSELKTITKQTTAAELNPELEALSSELASNERNVVAASLQKIANLGEAALPLTAELRDVLAHNDLQLAERAADAVAKIGPQAVAECENQLADLLSRGDNEAKNTALYAFQKNKEVAVRHIKNISNLTQSDDIKLVDSALFTISKIGPEAADVAPAIAKTLQHNDPKLREEAAFTLGRIRNLDDETIQALIETSRNDKVAKVREAAANTLRLAHGGKQVINENSSAATRKAYEASAKQDQLKQKKEDDGQDNSY